MKNRISIGLAAVLMMTGLTSSITQAETAVSQSATPESVVELGLLPPTLQDFLHLQEGAVTPERGVALFVLAMLVHEDFPAVAEEMVIAATTDNNLVTKSDGTKVLLPYMRDHLGRIAKDPAIARSYVEGATPQNGYTIPPGAGYKFHFSRNRLSEVSETEVRVYIKTSGAGTPRPVFLKKEKNGIWKVEEMGSLFVGIYLPASN